MFCTPWRRRYWLSSPVRHTPRHGPQANHPGGDLSRGGGADTMARLIAPKLGEALGQPSSLRTSPVPVARSAHPLWPKAAPDGYTR